MTIPAQPTALTKTEREYSIEIAGRHLRLIPGGKDAADVAYLQRALAAQLDEALPHKSIVVPISRTENLRELRLYLQAELSAGIDPATAVILRTSGSTSGQGSLIAISMEALVASARATHARLGGAGLWVLALPAHHVAGLQILVRCLLAQTEPVVVSESSCAAVCAGVEQALRVAAARKALPVYVSLVPTQLLRIIADPGARQVLARTSAVLVGGAALDAGVRAQALAAQIPVVRTYGMSETGGGCIYDGTPLAGVEMRLQAVQADGTGQIVLSGPVLAAAIYGQSSCYFSVDAQGKRELITCDRGAIRQGKLRVLGRLDEVIISGGIKIEPYAVEQSLQALPAVEQCCVVGVKDAHWGQAVVAVVVPSAGNTLSAEQIRLQARKNLSGAQCPKQIFFTSQLPFRQSGKIDRRTLAKRVEKLYAASK